MKDLTYYLSNSREDRHFREKTVPIEGLMRQIAGLLKFSVCAGFLVSVAACQFKKDDQKVKTPSPESQVESGDVKTLVDDIKKRDDETSSANITASDIKFWFDEGDPKAYILNVKLPNRVKFANVSISPLDSSLDISGEQTAKFHVFSNTVYMIEVTTRTSVGAPISKFKFNATSPTDIVYSGLSMVGNSRVGAHRIFLQSAQLITAGNDFELHADILVASDSSISTFADARSAVSSIELLKKSLVAIHAKKISGNLKINMLGATGSSGRSGYELAHLPGVIRARGKNGSPGKPGISHVVFGKCRLDTRTKEEVCSSDRYVCDQQPTSGDPGEPGPQSLDGEAGENGTDSGNLAIFSEDISEAKILIIRRPGEGGLGGPPEPPRLGGDHGPPGAMDPNNVCTPAPKVNSIGPEGRTGSWGRNGVRGHQGTYILPNLKETPFNIQVHDE